MIILDEKSGEYSSLEYIRFSYSGEQELGKSVLIHPSTAIFLCKERRNIVMKFFFDLTVICILKSKRIYTRCFTNFPCEIKDQYFD